ncbi:Sister chromatid cohesion protein PDS5-like protein, partial [Stegodyphus mimosarum]
MFTTDLKTILQSFVKEVLFKDKELPRGGTEIWAPFDSLPDETKVKIEGMKFMVRWLAGLKDMVQPLASTLRLLTLVIERRGDISMNQHTAPFENSWLRLSAAKCMLKLCQEATYVASMTLTQFQNLAFVIHDPCLEVRDRFAQKLNKGLSTLKLPLEFLAIFALAGLDERKEFRAEVKRYLTNNITKRREYVKDHVLSNDDLLAYLPDYSLPYAIHLLAHLPFFTTYNDVPSLLKIKDCLSLLMEPLISKNENYSFSFFKRLLENIKQTKDKQAPDDSDANLKLYAVCDLALSLIISKKNISLKD